MKKRKTIISKTDIENLISELHTLYPQLDCENISTLDQAKAYFLQLDLLVRSSLFRNTLLDLSDLIINLSRKVESPLLSDLKSQNSKLREVFHELFIGNYFNKNGYDIIYQPEFVLDEKPKTPDWIIEKNEQKAIIEVFSLNKYEDYRNEEYFILLLSERIKELEKHHNVTFDFNKSRLQIKSLFNKPDLIDCIDSIIHDIKSWLCRNQIAPNTRFDTLFGLEVIISDFHLNQKMIGGGAHSYRLTEKIVEKYEKYKEIIRRNKTPFIIACITDSLHRLNMDCFQDIIFGIPPSSFSRNKDGVINKQNELYEISGFMLFDLNVYSNQIDYEYIQNPNAKYPMELIINKKSDKRKNESIGWFL